MFFFLGKLNVIEKNKEKETIRRKIFQLYKTPCFRKVHLIYNYISFFEKFLKNFSKKKISKKKFKQKF